MSKTNSDLSKLSTEELEAILAEKKKAEQEERLAKRKEYEKDRDQLVIGLGHSAVALSKSLIQMKSRAFKELTAFREQMLMYGDLRGKEKNKGNFTLQTEHYKIEFKSATRKAFDERAELAEEKLRTFLNTFLKKKAHRDVVDLITSVLERNKSGDYDINLISRLYSMKDRFNDPNWSEAIELFQESYRPTGTAQYVRFFMKNEANNSWEPISLDMAAAKVEDIEEQG